MPFFSLEEAINCPPALIGDSSKGTNDNIQFCKNGASPFSGKSTKGTKLNSEKNSESEARNESVLSRWSDRASIQSFMNAISTLSAKKQQVEFQQQQQNKEIFDKFRLFMQQQQLERNQDQKAQQNQQQQQQNLTLNQQQQQQPILTLNTLQQQQQQLQQQQQTPSPEQNITLVQTKPKVRKVMKGGVLVSMPVSARHPPGGRGIEQPPRGESGPVTNHDKGFGSGNILDDILARSQGSKETSVVARKKVVISKTIADKGKGKQVASHKTGETVTTNELRNMPSIDNENITVSDSPDSKNIHKTGETTNAFRRSVRNEHAVTVSDSSDGKNININLSLTISMPGQEQQKAEIKHTTTIKKPSLAQTDNIVFDGSGSFVERSNVVESSNDEEPMPMGSTSELDGQSGVRSLPINVGTGTAPQNPSTDTESCVLDAQLKKPKLDPDASEQRKIQPIVISDTDNEEQGILINQTELNSKLDTATIANPDNDQANSLNMNQFVSNCQPVYITLSSPEHSHGTVLSIVSCISDTDNQNNVKASELISVDSVTKATPEKSSSNTSNVNSKPADNNGQSNGKVSKQHLVDKLDNEINRRTHTLNTDGESDRKSSTRKPSSLPRLDNDVTTSPDTRKQGNATQLKVDIKSDPAVTSHGSSDVFKQGNTTQTKVNIKPDPAVFSHGSSHILKEGNNITQGKINFKPDPAVTSPAFSGIVKQGNTAQTKMDIKPEPATVRMSSHDLVINIDSEYETLSKDINEKGYMNLSATDKQSNVNDSKTDMKPDIVTLNPDSSKQGNASTFVTAIKPDFVSINTDSSEAAKQDNDSKQQPTTVSPASSDLVVAIDSDAGGQRPSQSSPRQHNDMLENSQVKDQFKTDVKQNPVPQSPGSPSGDLFIDMDSDTELSTRATRRAKKRERYSSMTSESSSEEQKVSSFDWIRNLSEKLSNCVEKNMQEETTNSTTPPENDNTPSGNSDIRPKNTEQSGRKDNLPTAAQRQTSLVTTNTFPNKDIDVKGKNVFEEKQAGRDKKDTRVNVSLKRKEFDDESRNKTGKRKQNHKGIPSTNRQQSYTGRVTRSMSHSDVESGYTDENRTSLERPQGSDHNNRKRNSPGKQQGTKHRNDQRRSSRDWQEKASNTDQNRRASFPRTQETSSKSEQRRHPSSERSRRRSPPPQRQHETRGQHEPRGQHTSSRQRQKETNNKNQRKRSPPGNRSQGRQPSYELSKGASHGNEKRRHSPRGEERSSLERQEKSVVIVKENVGAPSLLSMLSNDTFDVTVAQQELSDQRKNNKRGGKKKKRKKPSAWFLRQIQKEKEMREKGQQPRRQVPRERLLPCLYYRGGKCSKGATCQFKHEKIKELCRFYVTRVCDKHPDGMCPRMHEEFPCTFFHTRNHCSSGNTCKYSHAPLTDETREILEKYVTEMAQRRQALDHPVINTASEQISVIAPIQENNGPSTSSNLTTAMNSNPGLSHETNPNIVGFSTASKPGVGLNPASITPPLRKLTVDTPKVQRLCSLSSYKPQLLSSLVSSVEKGEKQAGKVSDKAESVSSTSKGFLPGMFKER